MEPGRFRELDIDNPAQGQKTEGRIRYPDYSWTREGRLAGIRLVPRVIGQWPALDRTVGRCMICWRMISPDEETTVCPHCGRAAHVEHMRVWLRQRSFCPVCRGSL